MKKIYVLNGPNLNLLGKREPHVYGQASLQDLIQGLEKCAKELGIVISSYQSNHEGDIIDRLHEANEKKYEGVILNPGAFTHYSYAIRDAIAGIDIPVVEIHLSNVHARESFRRESVTAPVSIGQISGFGFYGYHMALHALLERIKGEQIHE
ncbi:type II 3-dehydroquinate dehydratase [Bacillus chungangensis]|uniref:3-dehydroquinate dehydratase n=1 Tax=Bacillus chungangensis TaxID=587633 RepID=A0ABT9WPE2_9BACI|nr:type II 3-dehydroquinate dehydratase [Bacillus chungangensis]MDQ0175149.1 3-dehydroquinate dehydratase-2 [Bacillus chungangensis]